MILSKPDIVIVGCGDIQILPTPEFINYFTSQDIGIEIMTTESACKTFNVLSQSIEKKLQDLYSDIKDVSDNNQCCYI